MTEIKTLPDSDGWWWERDSDAPVLVAMRGWRSPVCQSHFGAYTPLGGRWVKIEKPDFSQPTVSPKCSVRPWKIEEVPLDAWFRYKWDDDRKARLMKVVAVDVSIQSVFLGGMSGHSISVYDLAREYEYSQHSVWKSLTDERCWHPCHFEEQSR